MVTTCNDDGKKNSNVHVIIKALIASASVKEKQITNEKKNNKTKQCGA